MEKCFKRINLENATRDDVLKAMLDLIQTCENGNFAFNKTEVMLIGRFLDRYKHFTKDHNELLFPWANEESRTNVIYLGYPLSVLNKIFNYKGQVLTRQELDWLLTEKFDLKLTKEELEKRKAEK